MYCCYMIFLLFLLINTIYAIPIPINSSYIITPTILKIHIVILILLLIIVTLYLVYYRHKKHTKYY